MFLHKRGDNGGIGEYWLEAEQSRHRVGGEQQGTKEEHEDALAREKATSEVIGTKAMGKRFNVLMTIQIPLKQSKKEETRPFSITTSSATNSFKRKTGSSGPMRGAPNGEEPLDQYFAGLIERGNCYGARARGRDRGRGGAVNLVPRVSPGDYQGPCGGISVTAPKRNTAEHVTVTCVLYNTVTVGVPSAEDCKAAVEDMEK